MARTRRSISRYICVGFAIGILIAIPVVVSDYRRSQKPTTDEILDVLMEARALMRESKNRLGYKEAISAAADGKIVGGVLIDLNDDEGVYVARSVNRDGLCVAYRTASGLWYGRLRNGNFVVRSKDQFNDLIKDR